MLNSIGLQNPGVDAVVGKYAATWAGWKVPVIVNVAGESVSDYVEVTRRLEGAPGVAGIELNISCPNVGKGGLQFAIDAAAAGDVTAAVRRVTDLPLLVKLSPNVADVRPIARAIADAGADALTAINTLSGIAVAPGRSRPLLGNIYGGLSGPAVKPVALRIVYEAVGAVDIPVVGIGGVTELADVLDFLAVGAVAVQVGTAIFADPTLPVRLVGELAAECARLGLASHRDLIGTALPRRPPRGLSTDHRTCTWYGMCMFSQRTQVLLSPQQVEKLKRIAARDGRSVGAVIRDAVDSYVDPGLDARTAAADAIISMRLPVDDWEVMKREIEASRYPPLEDRP
jgi:dihydroorotate dehydrogenase (NAD+) catalytic subunit